MEKIMIEHMAAMIADEMNGAAKYAECALKHKADRPRLAEMFREMAEQEIGHMDKLIESARQELKAMQAAYSQA